MQAFEFCTGVYLCQLMSLQQEEKQTIVKPTNPQPDALMLYATCIQCIRATRLQYKSVHPKTNTYAWVDASPPSPYPVGKYQHRMH